MANNDVPSFLQNRLLLGLKVEELAESGEHGISAFIESAKNCAGKYVLFVDEIQTLFKSHIKGVALFEYLKPILAEGKVRLIGATTTNEATHFMDATVARRFQHIPLRELTIDQAIQALTLLKDSYEKYYGKLFECTFTIQSEAFSTAVKRAKLFYPNQVLPASAINLLENACSQKGLSSNADSLSLTAEDFPRLPEAVKPRSSWFSSIIQRISSIFFSIFSFMIRA
jgi:ATP-dependent Clp protease ATP-binding subunit ClpA